MNLRPVAWLMRSRLYPTVFQAAIAAVFVLVVYQLLAGPAAAHNNFGTAMTWVLWWPLIPIFFLAARAASGAPSAPSPRSATWSRRWSGHNRPVPAFLKKYGIWIIDAVFILITWADHVFGIVESPGGSGVLLLVAHPRRGDRRAPSSSAAPGAATSASWAGSRATTRARARSSCAPRPPCAPTARSRPCYKGSEKAPGCPMFEFPRTMDTNANCNLCGYCVKNCPNDSIQLSVRHAHPGAVVHPQAQVRGVLPRLVIMGIVFVQNITMLEVWAEALGWLEASPAPTATS